ncbi:hypothetical protein SKAU_G00330810 [Synaphobranchus kaupii]|uniref:Uncharacterized protein n=1 Tax=Synaphobranchus kaupii TaxID=118154 RepID=A0A9Q1EL36_SYNKA|nr:hypothetical protein SKAU_G00330810 [Synaphobranchus kaupii]
MASIIRTFRNENRIDVRLNKIQRHIIDNDDMFNKRVMELDAAENHHKFLFVDEAGFNLARGHCVFHNFFTSSTIIYKNSSYAIAVKHTKQTTPTDEMAPPALAM